MPQPPHARRIRKGVILAAGKGERLSPLTRVTNKVLLPVYDRPTVNYPLDTLLRAGIADICFVVSPQHAGSFLSYLGSGRDYHARFMYEIQEEPLGIAHGLSLAETFVQREPFVLVLGDNIFEDDLTDEIHAFSGSGAKMFVKEVPDPERFGVVEFDEHCRVRSIEEKPKAPKSSFVQTGLYCYDDTVFDKIRAIRPSARGELEITDVYARYLTEGTLTVHTISGRWFDTGTFDALLEASIFMAGKGQKA